MLPQPVPKCCLRILYQGMGSDPDDSQALACVGTLLAILEEEIDPASRPVDAPGTSCQRAVAANGATSSKSSQRIEKASALVIVFNADPAPVEFSLPPSDYQWHCVFTTADTEVAVTESGSVAIEQRSVQLFELKI